MGTWIQKRLIRFPPQIQQKHVDPRIVVASIHFKFDGLRYQYHANSPLADCWKTLGSQKHWVKPLGSNHWGQVSKIKNIGVRSQHSTIIKNIGVRSQHSTIRI